VDQKSSKCSAVGDRIRPMKAWYEVVKVSLLSSDWWIASYTGWAKNWNPFGIEFLPSLDALLVIVVVVVVVVQHVMNAVQ